jgi:uncharacterized protein YggT (Ycf19 family)
MCTVISYFNPVELSVNGNLSTVEFFARQLYQKEGFVEFVRAFCIFLLNAISYLYIFLKFFKVLCYSKMTFEWLPMINPYIWPFSVFHVLTDPYFYFWSRVLPSIKLDQSSVEISAIIALEVLNSLIFFCVRFTDVLVTFLEEIEKVYMY